MDAALAWMSGVKDLPRIAYALLRSPLLSVSPKGHPDLRAATRHLWFGLPPHLLQKAVYPALMSYRDPDTLVSKSEVLILVLPVGKKLALQCV